jgi:YggT family protein
VRAFVCLFLQLYLVVLILRILLSWVPSLPEPIQPLARVLRALTDPVLTPLRGIIPPVRVGMAALDLSPLIVFFGIYLILGLLC